MAESRQVRRAKERRQLKDEASVLTAALLADRQAKSRARRRERVKVEAEKRRERKAGQAERSLRYMHAHARQMQALTAALKQAA